MTLRTVATLNSFNQAANVLNYTQSTVSEQIKMLEQDLNVRLFKRAGKHIILTEAGELLLEYAQKMLDIEEEIKAEISDREEIHGALSIRVPETVSTYYLPLVLQQFHQRFPKVRVNIENCTYSGLPQELQSGIINLAFLLIPGALRLPQVEAEILRKIPLVVVAHPDHPRVLMVTLKEKLDRINRIDMIKTRDNPVYRVFILPVTRVFFCLMICCPETHHDD